VHNTEVSSFISLACCHVLHPNVINGFRSNFVEGTEGSQVNLVPIASMECDAYFTWISNRIV